MSRIKKSGLIHCTNIIVTTASGHKIFEVDADIELAIKCYTFFKENYCLEYTDNELNIEIEVY